LRPDRASAPTDDGGPTSRAPPGFDRLNAEVSSPGTRAIDPSSDHARSRCAAQTIERPRRARSGGSARVDRGRPSGRSGERSAAAAVRRHRDAGATGVRPLRLAA
jgi:hypothetical protein